MQYINYNGDNISKLSLGTVQFGLNYGIANSGGKLSQYEVNQITGYLWDEGLNCFDTAQAYGNSEEVLGQALRSKKDPFVISKLKSELFVDDAIKHLTKSLDNLELRSLYGLLLHDCALLYGWKDKHSLIVDKLISSGRIKYFGVSIYSDEDFELAIKNEKIQIIQIPFNLFDQRAVTKGWLDRAKKKNKLIFIRSVFLQGLLLMDINKLPTKLKSAETYLRRFSSYCKKLEMTRNELALSFVDSLAQDSLILFGCDNLQQAKENIQNYNSIKRLTHESISNLVNAFNDVGENIYNPTKWKL